MYFHQKDIFWALDKTFVKNIMKISTSESYRAGDMLFRQGDAADHFYILLKGRIKLIHGEEGHTVHIASNAGEAFGWSSLVGRATYSASAQCMAPTKLIRFDKHEVQQCTEKDPANGLAFYKRIAGILGSRLLQSYSMITAASRSGVSPSFGTGQVITPPAVDW